MEHNESVQIFGFTLGSQIAFRVHPTIWRFKEDARMCKLPSQICSVMTDCVQPPMFRGRAIKQGNTN